VLLILAVDTTLLAKVAGVALARLASQRLTGLGRQPLAALMMTAIFVGSDASLARWAGLLVVAMSLLVVGRRHL
jgi:hypothetical protein